MSTSSMYPGLWYEHLTPAHTPAHMHTHLSSKNLKTLQGSSCSKSHLPCLLCLHIHPRCYLRGISIATDEFPPAHNLFHSITDVLFPRTLCDTSPNLDSISNIISSSETQTQIMVSTPTDNLISLSFPAYQLSLYPISLRSII